MAAKEPKRCVFCGAAGPLTNEHIFPGWLNETLGLDLPRDRTAGQWPTGGYPAQSFTRPSRGMDMVLKTTCGEKCNNGWISDLDGAVKPHLLPLVMGYSHGLNRTAQRVLSAWACKTVLVLLSKNPRRLRSHYAETFGICQPPTRAQVWIGKCSEMDPWGWLQHDLQLVEDPALLRPHAVNGYGTTLIVGHALFQVVGHELPEGMNRTLSGPLADILAAIWPMERGLVPWPGRLVARPEELGLIGNSVIPGI